MIGNRGGQPRQDIKALQLAGLSDGQQTSRSEFAVGAAVAKADFAPLHAGAEHAFDAVVGRLHAVPFEKSEQSLVMLEKSCGQVAHFPVTALQMPLGQCDDASLDRNGSQDQLAPVNVTAAKLVPETEQSGMLGEGVAAETLHRAACGELEHSQQGAFQMCPATAPNRSDISNTH
jgi:hypothetical protein